MNVPVRIADAEALARYRDEPLHELGAAAHESCCAKHPEPYRTFAIDRNVNYTNVCLAGCRFCAFSVRPGAPGGWVLGRDELLGKIAELSTAGGTHVLLQGGLNPDLSLDWHERMLREVREAFPSIRVHGYSPPEIWFLHEQSGLSLAALLDRLRLAGLDSVPGGGAEILVDRVRRSVSPGKCSADQWLQVMRQAHALGMPTTATMMFGHMEAPAERIEHLRRLRELQDESLNRGRGRFTAFICWTFQPHNTALEREWRGKRGQEPFPHVAQAEKAPGPFSCQEPYPHVAQAETAPDPFSCQEPYPHVAQAEKVPDPFSVQPPWFQAGAVAYLRTLAVARLYLDNFDNLQASWVTQGPKIGQLALFYGANDMGGAMMEENVVSAAGTTYALTPDDLRGLIREAGWQGRQRNVRYELVDS